MIDVQQIFIKHDRPDGVIELLKAYLDSSGFEFSERLLPKNNFPHDPLHKKRRHFFVSKPVNDWIGVFEDLILMEQNLAEYLSRNLAASSVWLAYSERTEFFEYHMFANGIRIEHNEDLNQPSLQSYEPQVIAYSGLRKRTASELAVFEAAERFYERNNLPLRFYSYESISAFENVNEFFTHVNFHNRSAIDWSKKKSSQ